MQKLDALFVFEYGAPETLSSNQALSHAADYWIKWRRIKSAIVQRNIRISEEASAIADIFVFDEGSYTSTPQVIVRSLPFKKERGWQRVGLLAAPQHVWRCERDLAHYGYEVEVLPVLQEIGVLDWYSSASAHRQTRGALCWWSREYLLRLLRWASFSAYERITDAHKTPGTE